MAKTGIEKIELLNVEDVKKREVIVTMKRGSKIHIIRNNGRPFLWLRNSINGCTEKTEICPKSSVWFGASMFH